jgi:arsenate reductase
MAEGYLRSILGSKFGVYSAGIETHGVNPKAITVMAEDSVDISRQTSNNVSEYNGVIFDFIITVCDNANENCPYFPSTAKRLHYNFPDPAKATGNEEEILNAFRSTRDQIKKYCKEFVHAEL